jgi:repressor LexA
MGSIPSLTARQDRVLQVFRTRAREGLSPPTYRDLCREFGWHSTGTARDHIRALVRKGLVDPASGRARGTRLRVPVVPPLTLPLMGRIVAGRPEVIEEDTEEEVSIPAFLAPSGPAFLLVIHGDSMRDAGILDGDVVVVRATPEPMDGEIAAVTVDGETTLKRLLRKGRTWVLMPENPNYQPIEIRTSDAVIHGVATGLLRSLEGQRGRRPPGGGSG